MKINIVSSTGWLNVFPVPSKFLAIPDGEPSSSGDFVAGKIHSETVEVDKIFDLLVAGNTDLLQTYCKIIGEKEPDRWTEEKVIRVIVLGLMTKAGHMMDRKISTALPENKPIEFYDFGEYNTTDDGRLLWQMDYSKRDLRIICESRNRYK